MDASISAAARAAGARAASCRARAAQLAARPAVQAADVRRAGAALRYAEQRAALAQQRLAAARCRSGKRRGRGQVATVRHLDGPFPGPGWAPDVVRDRARRLPLAELFASYLGVGGTCSEFELDAFLHAALVLPAEELTALGQAVWELIEF